MAEPTPGVYPPSIDDPHADDETQPFWEAALEGRLVTTRCTQCGTCILPPQPRCFACQGTGFEWVDLPGTGTIYSFTVVRHPLTPQQAEIVPYASGVIDLDGTQGAGARMIANLVGVDPDAVRIGDKVRVDFDHVSDTYAVPRFRPA